MILTILEFAGLCTFGMLIDIFFNRVPKLKERCKAAKVKFSFSEYLNEDWLCFVQQGVFIGAFLSLSAVIMRTLELPIEYMYFLSLISGAYGANLLTKRYSSFGKKLLAIIDKNTELSGRQYSSIRGGQDSKKESPKQDPPKDPPPGGDRPEIPINPIVKK